jgi:glutaconyl-CoA/methylmalonyl-CoA decarboxylase subunit gamma
MTNYTLTIDEQTFDVEIGSIQGNLARVTVNQIPYYVKIDASGQVTPQAMTVAPAPGPAVALAASSKAASPKRAGSGTITAPIPGKILTMMVKVGDRVTAGQVLAVIEAMKMENNIISPIDGTVTKISVVKDDDVGTGDEIMVIG